MTEGLYRISNEAHGSPVLKWPPAKRYCGQFYHSEGIPEYSCICLKKLLLEKKKII